MDHIPSYEFSVVDLYRRKKIVINTRESAGFDDSRIFYSSPKYSIYVETIVSFNQPEAFVF